MVIVIENALIIIEIRN